MNKDNNPKMVFDENKDINPDSEKLPVHPTLNVIRYHTLKKSSALGWWSAVVLVESFNKKEICYYRWRKKDDHWKRDKKLPIRSRKDWDQMKEIIEKFLPELEK